MFKQGSWLNIIATTACFVVIALPGRVMADRLDEVGKIDAAATDWALKHLPGDVITDKFLLCKNFPILKYKPAPALVLECRSIGQRLQILSDRSPGTKVGLALAVEANEVLDQSDLMGVDFDNLSQAELDAQGQASAHALKGRYLAILKAAQKLGVEPVVSMAAMMLYNTLPAKK